MTASNPDEPLTSFDLSENESTRLTRKEGRVELLRTRALLRDRLEAAQRILDVGGASGAHLGGLVAAPGICRSAVALDHLRRRRFESPDTRRYASFPFAPGQCPDRVHQDRKST